eukprot:5664033-Pleurochrysis_carterae.AAC.1
MHSRSAVCGGCTKCRSGSGTANRFLRWLLRGRALRLSRRWGARGSGSLTCRCGCVSEFPLQLSEGPLTPTALSKQFRTLRPKELRPLEAVTKRYSLTRDTSRKPAASLGRITEVSSWLAG